MYKIAVKNNNVSTIQPSRNDVIRNVRRKNMYGELANNLYQKMNSLMIFDSSTDTLFAKMKQETRLSREFIRGKPIVQGKTITLEAEIPKLVPIDAPKKWVDFKDYGTEFCKKDGNPNKVVYEKKVYSHTIPQSNYSALALALRGLKNYHRLDIQMHRERMKKLYTETRMVRINECRNIELKMIGLCFTKPNEIKRVYDMRQAGSVFDIKKPLTNDKYIGIELEFYSESETDDLGAALLS